MDLVTCQPAQIKRLGVFRVAFSTVLLDYRFTCGSDGQLPVFDAFGADEPVGDMFNFQWLALDYKDFETIVMVKMHMQGRDNQLQVIMLD